jgi:hypothetical protein
MKRVQRFHAEKIKLFNAFVDDGVQHVNRSESHAWFILFRDMQGSGFSQTSRTEIARRGGMSLSQASRALQSLIDRKFIFRACEGYPGKASLYTLFEPGELVKFSPPAKALIEKYSQPKGSTDATCTRRIFDSQSAAPMRHVSAAPVRHDGDSSERGAPVRHIGVKNAPLSNSLLESERAPLTDARNYDAPPLRHQAPEVVVSSSSEPLRRASLLTPELCRAWDACPDLDPDPDTDE